MEFTNPALVVQPGDAAGALLKNGASELLADVSTTPSPTRGPRSPPTPSRSRGKPAAPSTTCSTARADWVPATAT